MAPHPYRTPGARSQGAEPQEVSEDRLEERVLLAVIFIVGAIGVTIGIASNMQRTTEPVIGFLMVILAIRSGYR